MGMVPAQSAAFLRLSDGKVIGVAQPASPGPRIYRGGDTSTSAGPAEAGAYRITTGVRQTGEDSASPVRNDAGQARGQLSRRRPKPAKR
jgi:hypothetical protein